MNVRFKLIELRKSKGLTQEELADQCNISVRTIQRIESGAVQPRANTVKIISQHLGVDFFSQQNPLHYSFLWHIKDLFNLKTHKMKKITILSLIGIVILLSSSLVSSKNQVQSTSSFVQSNGKFKVVKESAIDGERLAFATKISSNIMEEVKEGGYYQLSASEAENRMVQALNENTQRSAYEQLSGAFGDYKGLEFVQLVIPTNGTMYEIYRFKGLFGQENAEVEIRSVLNAQGKLAGFFMIPWNDKI